MILIRNVAANLVSLALPLLACIASAAESDVLRVAIIGTDTSHCLAFTQLINSADAVGSLAKVQVVVAYPGGSADIASSRDRVRQFAEQLKESAVEIADSAEAAATRADAILLESVDGRVHLELFRRIATGKPVFIDKPAAASVADFLQIVEIAKRTNTPFFSASALRFSPEVLRVAADKSVGHVLGAATSTPYQTEPHHPDLFWYGIHGVEALATLLGPGCEQVERRDTKIGALLIGKWRDGRQGTVWALATHSPVYSFNLYGDQSVAAATGFSGYANLVTEICDFFVTRQPPVSSDATLEILAMMEAADESRRHGGEAVSIASVIERARKDNGARHTGEHGQE